MPVKTSSPDAGLRVVVKVRARSAPENRSPSLFSGLTPAPQAHLVPGRVCKMGKALGAGRKHDQSLSIIARVQSRRLVNIDHF